MRTNKEGISPLMPEAIDLSHHLSEVAKARRVSPLKNLQRHLNKDGLISMGGGLPNPAYFPFARLEAEALKADAYPVAAKRTTSSAFSWLFRLLGGSGARSKEKTTHLAVQKYPTKPDDLNLATALQYGMAKGVPQLQKFIDEVTRKVYKPAYGNYVNLVHAGNTDGWFKCVQTLCNPGDGILVSEWTYPSTIASMVPYNIKPVPVSMDGQGMSAVGLRQVLSKWDVPSRGMPRPHVLYIVPIGQNPTGATMGLARKKELYDVCIEFDIIIVEDDPYYFLQHDPYVRKANRHYPNSSLGNPTDEADVFVSQLAPSFLSIDYQGRVIRLESFSKTISPGCRLGWFTCNPVFAERLERQAETTSQAPCGYSQSMTTALLLEWKYDGYIRWLRALGTQYQHRRDYLIDRISQEFHLESEYEIAGIWSGHQIWRAYEKNSLMTASTSAEKLIVSQPIFSFVPPTAGMYIWMQLHLENYPSMSKSGDDEEDEGPLEMKLWAELADAGVVFSPGWMFSAAEGVEDPLGLGHFRISFSFAEYDEIKRGIAIFATVLRNFSSKARS